MQLLVNSKFFLLKLEALNLMMSWAVSFASSDVGAEQDLFINLSVIESDMVDVFGLLLR